MPLDAAADPIPVVLDTKTEIAPSKDYLPGKNQIDVVAIAPEANSTRIFFGIEGWPNPGVWTDKEMDPKLGFTLDQGGHERRPGDAKSVVEIRQFVSRDNGVTWDSEGSATYAANNPLGKQHVECAPNFGTIMGAEKGGILVRVEIEVFDVVGKLKGSVSLKPEFIIPRADISNPDQVMSVLAYLDKFPNTPDALDAIEKLELALADKAKGP